MKTQDVENLVWQAKFIHLRDDELEALQNHRLDPVRDALAKAHLRICLACETKFATIEQVKQLIPFAWQAILGALAFSAYRATRAHFEGPREVHHLAEGGRRGVYFEEQENGDLVITLGSRAPESETLEYELYLSGYEKGAGRFRFVKRPDGQFLGRVVIPFSVRQEMPKEGKQWMIKELAAPSPSKL